MDNTQGKWYFVKLKMRSWTVYDSETDTEQSVAEVVFMRPGESIAKYVRKKCLANTRYQERGYRGMAEGDSCLIEELSLLLPDGTKVSGFKPHSLKEFFVDS